MFDAHPKSEIDERFPFFLYVIGEEMIPQGDFHMGGGLAQVSISEFDHPIGKVVTETQEHFFGDHPTNQARTRPSKKLTPMTTIWVRFILIL